MKKVNQQWGENERTDERGRERGERNAIVSSFFLTDDFRPMSENKLIYLSEQVNKRNSLPLLFLWDTKQNFSSSSSSFSTIITFSFTPVFHIRTYVHTFPTIPAFQSLSLPFFLSFTQTRVI